MSTVYAPKRGRAKEGDKKNIVQKSFYEDLIQLGDKDSRAVGTIEGEEAKQVLMEWFNGNAALGIPSYQERNPNLHVFNAVIHMDESTPAIHLDYIPWYESARGQSVQQGVNRAFEACGHGSRDDPNIRDNYRLAERAVLEKICAARGIEIKPPEKGVGVNYKSHELQEIARLVEEGKENVQGLQDRSVELESQIGEDEGKLSEINEKRERQDNRYLRNSKIIEDQEIRVKELTDSIVPLEARKTALEGSIRELSKSREDEEKEEQKAIKRRETAENNAKTAEGTLKSVNDDIIIAKGDLNELNTIIDEREIMANEIITRAYDAAVDYIRSIKEGAFSRFSKFVRNVLKVSDNTANIVDGYVDKFTKHEQEQASAVNTPEKFKATIAAARKEADEANAERKRQQRRDLWAMGIDPDADHLRDEPEATPGKTKQYPSFP
jgi:hypothetical protein